MSDKRRRARVQGSWASQGKTPIAAVNKGQVSLGDTSSVLNQTPVDQPRWLHKNTDNAQLPLSHRFFYEPQNEVLKEKPQLKVIEKDGVYDISTEPSGLSRLRYFSHFLDDKQADDLYEHLLHELPWQQMTGVHNGHKYLQPRMNAFYCDVEYSYSGTVHPPTPQWPTKLAEFKGQLEQSTGLKFNGVLANLYRDEHDSVAWHSDDEPELGPNPTVVSISLGAMRNFYLRTKISDNFIDDYSDCQHYKIPLTHGSLLIMEGSTQSDWQHCIPKEYHSRQARINLTFRAFVHQ